MKDKELKSEALTIIKEKIQNIESQNVKILQSLFDITNEIRVMLHNKFDN